MFSEQKTLTVADLQDVLSQAEGPGVLSAVEGQDVLSQVEGPVLSVVEGRAKGGMKAAGLSGLAGRPKAWEESCWTWNKSLHSTRLPHRLAAGGFVLARPGPVLIHVSLNRS